MVILVTGGTGTVGSQVVRFLSGIEGVRVRIGAHHMERASGLVGDNVEAAHFDYMDPGSMAQALEGVDKVYLLTPPGPQGSDMVRRAIDVMRGRPIAQVVRQSVLNAEREPAIALTRDHRAAERALEESGLPYTILRPNYFMENLYGWRESIRRQGEFYMPLDDARLSWIAVQDIGEVAARVLLTDGHLNKAYDLTGPEALTGEEVATALCEAVGRQIRYVPVSEEMMRDSLTQSGLPAETIDSYAELFASYRNGDAARVSPVTHAITGHPATSIRGWARKHASAFREDRSQAA